MRNQQVSHPLTTNRFGTSAGRVLHSTDLGTTWSASTTPLDVVNSVWFNDSLVGLIAEAGNAKSTNGGNSWTLITGSVTRVVGDGYKKFFGIGNNGVYESADTSFNWYNVFSYAGGGSLLDISAGRNGSTNFGWVVGTSGTIARYGGQISNVQDVKTVITGFTLSQNYPNPFNPITIISYSIPKSGFVALKIFDILGREVITLVNEEKTIGSYKVEFNATNLTSGIYFYQLQAGSFVETKKMVLMK